MAPVVRQLNPEGKRPAMQAYSPYILSLCRRTIPDVRPEQIGTLVKTLIINSNDEPVVVNYVAHDNDSAGNAKSKFANIRRIGGIDGLITSLDKKADEPQSCARVALSATQITCRKR